MNHCSDNTLNSVLRQVCRAQRVRANTLFSEFGLHVGQERIILALSEQDGLTLSQLAESLGVQPPTVTRMARRMGKSGLLTRRNCAEDGRVFRIHLTEKGHSVKEKLDEAWGKLEAETTQHLTSKQQATLYNLLSQVRDALTSPRQATKP